MGHEEPEKNAIKKKRIGAIEGGNGKRTENGCSCKARLLAVGYCYRCENEMSLFEIGNRTNLWMLKSGRVRKNFIGSSEIYVMEIWQTKLSRTGGAL